VTPIIINTLIHIFFTAVSMRKEKKKRKRREEWKEMKSRPIAQNAFTVTRVHTISPQHCMSVSP
jgi:hypothetical protein